MKKTKENEINKKENFYFLNLIPHDIKYEIFFSLTGADARALALVSKEWYSIYQLTNHFRCGNLFRDNRIQQEITQFNKFIRSIESKEKVSVFNAFLKFPLNCLAFCLSGLLFVVILICMAKFTRDPGTDTLVDLFLACFRRSYRSFFRSKKNYYDAHISKEETLSFNEQLEKFSKTDLGAKTKYKFNEKEQMSRAQFLKNLSQIGKRFENKKIKLTLEKFVGYINSTPANGVINFDNISQDDISTDDSRYLFDLIKCYNKENKPNIKIYSSFFQSDLLATKSKKDEKGEKNNEDFVLDV